MDRQFVTVTEFCNVIKNIFSCEEMLHNIAVIGEVSGFRSSGLHSYFNLKDQGAVLPCSCFNFHKTYIPKEGEKIIVIGSPDYYLAGGRFSMIVNTIEPQGIGLLFQKIEELKKRLDKEGIFADEHKIAIPKFCKNVCVVTSKSGAVIRDICHTIRKKNSIIDIVVKDVKVQGEFAVKEITSALKSVDKLDFDCVILARGGGSLEDLMPFYDEQVVRAVFAMETPIISAIGHETDYSLCDFAADKRCATPTAAGELLAYDVKTYIESILNYAVRVQNNVKQLFTNSENKTKYAVSSIGSGMEKLYQNNLFRLKISDKRIIEAVEKKQIDYEHKIDKVITALDKLNPTRILKSGYFRVYNKNLPITSIDYVSVGDKITVKGGDGILNAEVTEIIKEEI